MMVLVLSVRLPRRPTALLARTALVRIGTSLGVGTVERVGRMKTARRILVLCSVVGSRHYLKQKQTGDLPFVEMYSFVQS